MSLWIYLFKSKIEGEFRIVIIERGDEETGGQFARGGAYG
jgi:hypothetical protein